MADSPADSPRDSPDFETVKSRFVDICRCVAEPDVVEFAGELLQSNLISNAGHQAAIAVNASPSANKVARLVSEAMDNVSNSPDNFYKFISILECRNAQLASALRSDYSKRLTCSLPKLAMAKASPSTVAVQGKELVNHYPIC